MQEAKALSSKRKAPVTHEDGDEGTSRGNNSNIKGRKRRINDHLIQHTPFVASTNPPHDSLIQRVRRTAAVNQQDGRQQRVQAINNVTVISDMRKVVRPREGEEDTQ